MTKVTLVAFDGTRIDIDAENGTSLMEIAVRNGIPGIVAECGGACACATCHVYVDARFTDLISTPKDMEVDMLDFAYDVGPTSRLSCQIRIMEELNGLIVHLLERQG